MTCNPSALLQEWPWWSTLPCGVGPLNTFPGSTVVQEWSSTSQLGSITVGNRGGVDAFSVQVRFQSTDIPTLSSAYLSFFSSPNTLFQTSTNPSFLTQPPSATNGRVTITTTSVPQSQGLPIGAKAGIGVAVAIALVALLLLGAFVYLRRGQRKPAPMETMRKSIDAHGPYMKPELEAEHTTKTHEMAEGRIAELATDAHGPYMHPELAAENRIAELGCGSRGDR